MKRLVASGVALVVLAGAAGAAGAPPSPASRFVAFQGRQFGRSYELDVYNSAGSFRSTRRGCDLMTFTAGDTTASGCASARDLAGFGEVCSASGIFLHGLIPSATVLLRATTSTGRSLAGRLHALPARWRSNGTAWMLAVPRGLALRSIAALSRRGRSLAQHRFAGEELRCPSSLRVHGRLHRNVSWSFAVTRARGAGRIDNLCVARSAFAMQGAYGAGQGLTQCYVPPFPTHLSFSIVAEHSCSPGYTIFTGLLSPRVTDVVVVLPHGRRLHARILDVAGTSFRAFVVAAGRNENELAYLLHTSDGRVHRVGSGRLQSCPRAPGNIGLPAVLARR